jgi:alpha-L-fucosidase 2
MAKARKKIEIDSYPNLFIYAGGGGVETCSGIPGMINEMMLQSFDNKIRIFPVFPSDQKASFYQLRTFGAFLVSSAIDKGNVKFVIIESEKGRNCSIINPWKNKKVTLFRDGKPSETVSGENVTFVTKPGEVIEVIPEGGNFVEMEVFLKNNSLN